MFIFYCFFPEENWKYINQKSRTNFLFYYSPWRILILFYSYYLFNILFKINLLDRIYQLINCLLYIIYSMIYCQFVIIHQTEDTLAACAYMSYSYNRIENIAGASKSHSTSANTVQRTSYSSNLRWRIKLKLQKCEDRATSFTLFQFQHN